MVIIKTKKNLYEVLSVHRSKNRAVGFVPTMGALHAGHLSLIHEARSANDITVCSIFINPAQFNNKADLAAYPVTIESDIDKLEAAGCDILFLPSATEMYPEGETPEHYDLGEIEFILEGKYRPGHFQGVCMIVDKLLKAVDPSVMYLGRKDYQQCMVIKKMMALKGHNSKLKIVDTVREDSGLAMSSRNMRLSESERHSAISVITALRMMEDEIWPGDVSELKGKAKQFLQSQGFTVDYIEIAEAATLQTVYVWDGNRQIVFLTAATINGIRLIDNLVPIIHG